MRWQGGRRSDNVEDGRSESGGGGRTALVGGGVGTLVVVVIMLLMGADPQAILQQLLNGQGGLPGQLVQEEPAPEVNDPKQQELKDFAAVILGDTEDVWGDFFRQAGERYREPKLHLFSQHVTSGCGEADSGMGPFYCPADEKVYLDLAFFNELEQKFKAPGEFARAYVIAHEIGHHVQNVLGISDKVHQAQGKVSKAEYNHLSVRLELQADFFAGVWAYHANKKRHILEEGDVEAALRAATAIGDDRLQMQARGYVVPDSFTHGTSQQRLRWFKKGLQTGDVNQGDTFKVRDEDL